MYVISILVLLCGQVGCLQSTLQSVQHGADRLSIKKQPTTHQPASDDTTVSTIQPNKAKLHSVDVPSEPSNPYRQAQLPVCAHLTRTAGFQPSSTIQAHDYPISSLTLHPTKPLLVTGSDDHTWRMWSVTRSVATTIS